MALVHRPHDEPRELIERVEQSLTAKYKPETEGEREIVRGLAGDFARMGRLAKAEDAGTRLAKLDVGRRPEDNDLLLRIIECRGHWELLRKGVQRDFYNLPTPNQQRALRAAESIVKAEKTAKSLLKYQGEVDTSIPGSRELIDQQHKLNQCASAIDIAKVIMDLADAAKNYLDVLEEKLVGDEEERQTCQRSIAELPDDALVRRIDRYRRAVEGSMLRRLEILKSMRDLVGDAAVVVEN